MKVLYGQDLVTELRKCADNVRDRLWIAVPYIGGLASIRRVLGKSWFDNPKVSVKIITDVSSISNIDSEAVSELYQRGEVKSLFGLHAKVYIMDNYCLVTSANLTNTAFAKRHEIGILLQPSEMKPLETKFNSWWNISENITLDTLNKVSKGKRKAAEELFTFPLLWDLPKDPGQFSKNLPKRFLNYDRILSDYKDFAKKYSQVQRLWPSEPLFLEIDGLLNYLYHEAPRTPSKAYTSKAPRKLTEAQQLNEIKKWAKEYSKWNQRQCDIHGVQNIDWRLENSKTVQLHLAKTKVMKLKRDDIEIVLKQFNSLNSYPINRRKILAENSLDMIKDELNNLVNGSGPLAARMNSCNKLKYMGPSTMNEILGFAKPKEYPLINKNTNSGLRFFGYHLKAY